MREPDFEKEILRSEQPLIRELLDIDEWQKILDNFSAVTEVNLRMLDENGKAVTAPSRELKLCNELFKGSYTKDQVCGMCLPTFLGGKGVVDRNLGYKCPAGAYNFIAPLKVGEWVLGYVVVGPVTLVMLKAKEEYRQLAEELGVELDEFWNALIEIRVMSYEGVKAMVELLQDVIEHTLRHSYRCLANERREQQEMLAPQSARTSKLMEALLDVAFQVTGADVGSIMLLEKNKDELAIRTSRGISEDIRKRARVRLGDGISGTAAKERRAFLIDDSLQDNRIKPYLNRPAISSSMVIPIAVQDKVVGVVNLGALKSSSIRFNADNLKVVSDLISLATIALES